jgi:hypothetical protein
MTKNKKQLKQLKKENIKTEPIFRLKPKYGSYLCDVVCIGFVEIGAEIKDELMEIDTPKEMKDNIGDNTIHICSHDGYDIIGKMYKCNIKEYMLIGCQKIPLMYLSVSYQKKFITGFLMNIYFYFNVSDETMNEVKTDPNLYMKISLKGHFTLKIVSDDDFFEHFENFIRPSIQKDIIEFSNNNNLSNDDILNLTNIKINEYKKIFEPLNFNTYPHKNKIINTYMKKICSNDMFLDMLKVGVTIRDNARQKTTSYSFNIPKKINDLKELKKNPDEIKNILNNINDTDNSSVYSD